MKEELSALDWIAVSMTGIGVLWVALLFPYVITPSFTRMYADFGGKFPYVTRLVIAQWPSSVLGLVPAAFLAVALTGDRPIAARRALIVVGFLSSLAGIGFCLWGLYAPIFELAGKIQ